MMYVAKSWQEAGAGKRMKLKAIGSTDYGSDLNNPMNKFRGLLAQFGEAIRARGCLMY